MGLMSVTIEDSINRNIKFLESVSEKKEFWWNKIILLFFKNEQFLSDFVFKQVLYLNGFCINTDFVFTRICI